MSPDKTKRLVDRLTKGLFPPDLDALVTFFAQGMRPTQDHAANRLAQPTVMRLLNAGLIETVNVSSSDSKEEREFVPTSVTPKGKTVVDSLGEANLDSPTVFTDAVIGLEGKQMKLPQTNLGHELRKSLQQLLCHPGATPDSDRVRRPHLVPPGTTDQELNPGDRVEGLGNFGKPTGEVGTVEETNEEDAVVRWDGDGQMRLGQVWLKKIQPWLDKVKPWRR